MEKQIIEGVIDRVIYFNSDNCYSVLNIKQKNKYFVAIGNIPDISFGNAKNKLKDTPCKITGSWIKHKSFGWQFQFEKIQIETGTLFFFLTKIVSGIGAKLAHKLIKHYGESNLEQILDTNPMKLIEFKGIKEKKAQRIASSWKEYKHLKELNDFFVQNEANISSSYLVRIYNHFKEKGDENFIKRIKENPYILTEVNGIGFKTCDKIALQIGIKKDSLIRLEALIVFLLFEEADKGHTYLTKKQLWEKIIENIEPEKDTISGLKEKIKQIISYPKFTILDNDKLFFTAYYRYETYIKSYFEQKINFFYKPKDNFNANEFIAKKEKEYKISLSSEQKKAVLDIIEKGYSVYALCGYAGTGKTTVSRIILDYFAEKVGKQNIICCAFTGMASRRINIVTGYASKTIHSLLGFKKGVFEHNKDNPLPYKVVLLDEASMVNLSLFYALVSALPKNVVFIMVGDNAQLPPIGAGNVFSDILNYSWFPKTFLTKIFRQSSDSVLTLFANQIRKGKVPSDYKGKYKDFMFILKDMFIKDKNSKEAKEKREKLYEFICLEMLKNIKEIIKKEDYTLPQAIWNIQIITPMKNTLLGTKELNKRIQSFLNSNPVIANVKGIELKNNDKVIHLKNLDMSCVSFSLYRKYKIKGIAGIDIDKTKDYLDEKGLLQTKRIFNGNIGIIRDIDKDNELFTVVYPDDKDSIVVFYDFEDIKNIIDLGYALTIHKVQGNQFEYAIIPLVNAFYIMLNTKLLYTAITRAIKKVVIIGQKYAFEKGCKNIKETVRQTFLSL